MIDLSQYRSRIGSFGNLAKARKENIKHENVQKNGVNILFILICLCIVTCQFANTNRSWNNTRRASRTLYLIPGESELCQDESDTIRELAAVSTSRAARPGTVPWESGKGRHESGATTEPGTAVTKLYTYNCHTMQNNVEGKNLYDIKPKKNIKKSQKSPQKYKIQKDKKH